VTMGGPSRFRQVPGRKGTQHPRLRNIGDFEQVCGDRAGVSIHLLGVGKLHVDPLVVRFCLKTHGSGSVLAQIDPSNAHVIAENNLAIGEANNAFAYAFRGGVFWLFTGQIGSTTVTRYDPTKQTETPATTLVKGVVGAGV